MTTTYDQIISGISFDDGEHVCGYCLSHEHRDTNGVKSVEPKYQNIWCCSHNCLFNLKKNNGRPRPRPRSRSRKNHE